MEALSEDEVAELYEWVDSFELSRPKKAFARDFADGVLVAEIVHHLFPRLVELHNYSAANRLAQKVYNWETLNQRIFRRLGFSLPREQIEELADARPGAAERALLLLRARLARHQEQAVAQRGTGSAWPALQGEDAEPATCCSAYRPPGLQYGGESPAAQDGRDAIAAVRPWAADSPTEQQQQQAAAWAHEAEQALEHLRATNGLLETKVLKLEALVRLKDARLAALERALTGGAAAAAPAAKAAGPAAAAAPNLVG